jgi:phosphate transport system substrate-binding protein
MKNSIGKKSIGSKFAGMAIAILALIAPSVAPAQADALKGNVVVDGSSTVFPVTEAAAAAFRKDFPNVNVTVAVSGTGGGFKRFAIGETDISDASRPIRADEFQAAKAKGVQFIELPVALDGLSIVVNPKNDWVETLTVEQLQAIYLEDGGARKWSDLNAAWPDKPVKVYSPGTDSGTFDYFKEVVVPKGKSLRPDLSASEDDNVLVTGVAGDQYSIGYFGASYYYENKEKLKSVAIINPATGEAVHPDPEHVISGAYAPFGRPLFIYVNVMSLRRPEVRKFVEFYMQRAGEFATQVRYVAVPEEIHTRAMDFLKKRKSGTTYIVDGKEKREGGLTAVYVEENLVDTK